jgi:hypothetical protein
MKNLLIFCASLFYLGVVSASSLPEPMHNDWHLLGKVTASKGVDRDEIMVTAAEGLFTSLRLRVKRSPVEIFKCTVVFGDGSQQEIELREQIRAGGQSRIIDLKGNHRVIRKIVLWYSSPRPLKRQSIVELWGKH